MNAGRDVERLIADWFVEDAVPRAPDRLLDATGRVIDRTKQRRFGVAWREPMVLTTTRLVAAAVIVMIAIAGAGWLGRQTADTGRSGPPSTVPGAVESSRSPSTSPDAITDLQTYRAARDAVCNALTASPIPAPSGGISGQIAVLQQVLAKGDEEVRQLDAIAAPPSIQAEHLQNIQTLRDTVALIAHEVTLLEQGKTAEADAVDQATAPLSQLVEAFEAKYSLAPCP